MIRPLSQNDYDSWIELAAEVEPLFGPMTGLTEFQDGIRQCINNESAFGIEAETGDIAGIIAIDRDQNEIAWLAVGKKYRGNNFGEKLVKKASGELENKGDICVQTFSDTVKEGGSARRIYERNGFTDLKDSGKNPAGIDTVIMVRKKKV